MLINAKLRGEKLKWNQSTLDENRKKSAKPSAVARKQRFLNIIHVMRLISIWIVFRWNFIFCVDKKQRMEIRPKKSWIILLLLFLLLLLWFCDLGFISKWIQLKNTLFIFKAMWTWIGKLRVSGARHLIWVATWHQNRRNMWNLVHLCLGNKER